MPIELVDANPKTHIYHQLPITKDNGNDHEDLLVMIPGNPGLIEFYITYLDLIQQELPSFEVLCIAHAGFLGHEYEQDKGWFDLKFQIDHKYRILREFILDKYSKNNKVVHLYVLSHSMGSFVFQRSLQKLLQDETLAGKFEVRFTGFITPTILDIANSSLGKKTTRAMQFNFPIFAIAYILRALILFIFAEHQIKKLLGRHLAKEQSNQDILGLENSVVGSYKILESKSVITQALTMAQEEMHEIGLDETVNDWYFDKALDFKKWVFFAQDDHWVGNHTREHLIKKYGSNNGDDNKNDNVLIEVCRDLDNPIAHSFCVCQSKEFAEISVDRIVELCGLKKGE